MMIRAIFFFLIFVWAYWVTVGHLAAEPYAKIVGGKIVAIEEKKNPETANDSRGDPIWRPVIEQAKPPFDPSTEVMTRTETIEATRVVKGWAVRDKTQTELDAEAAATEANKIRRLNVFLQALCRLENHDRVSDGKTVWTLSQCRNGLKSLVE